MGDEYSAAECAEHRRQLGGDLAEIKRDTGRLVKAICGDLEGTQPGLLHRVSVLERVVSVWGRVWWLVVAAVVSILVAALLAAAMAGAKPAKPKPEERTNGNRNAAIAEARLEDD